MKILLVGGGSGGHVTPIIAIAKKLHELKPGAQIKIWTDKKFAEQTHSLAPKFAKVEIISSGKLRRYANLGFFNKYFSWYHLTHTHLPNLRDSFRILRGFFQSLSRLKRWRPDVIFCKGGYVCLPVGIAAHLLKIPLVIHDSDTVPGLTNRVLGRYAAAIATGAPVENYPNYPKKITRFVGIPVRESFRKLSESDKRKTRQQLDLDPTKSLILVAGGGGGATIFSRMFREIAPEIIDKFNAQIFLITGKGRGFDVGDVVQNYDENTAKSLRRNFIVREFITDEYADLLNSCDVFVSRAGATSLAEAATSQAATIIVPSPYLAGDHQTKNAEIFARAGAAIALKQNKTDDLRDEKLTHEMAREIEKLLSADSEKIRQKLSENLAKFAKKDALGDISEMILVAVEPKKHIGKVV